MSDEPTFVCKHCGSARIATVEQIPGLAGIMDIRRDADANHGEGRSGAFSYDFDGNGTKMFWDGSETTGFQCMDCDTEADELAQLVVHALAADELHRLFEMARKHGEEGEFEDGATHEVGDLQDLCRAMWELLTVEQRRSVVESDSVQNLTSAGV